MDRQYSPKDPEVLQNGLKTFAEASTPSNHFALSQDSCLGAMDGQYSPKDLEVLQKGL